jgi:hypothetical protein
MLSVPPLPEDPVLSKSAPEECLAYFAAAGRGSPQPDSPNHTEQLCAEPEVRALVAGVERLIRDGLARQKPRDEAQKVLTEEGPTLVKALLIRPLAVYLADLKPNRDGPPQVRGGAVLSLGDQAEKLTASLERCEALIKDRTKEVTIDGTTFRQMPLGPKGSEITWGVKGKYLYAAVGEGEMKALLGRAEGSAPKWLTAMHKRMPVERVSALSRVDVGMLIARLAPLAGPETAKVVKTTGLDGLQELASVSGLDKEGFTSRTLIRFRDEPKGLLKLLDQKPLTTEDLAIIPRDTTFAVAKSVDLKQVYTQVLKVVEALYPQGVDDFRKHMGEVEDRIGLKLERDVLEPLGDRWCVYASPGEGGLLTGLTLVASLKDPETAAKTHDKLLRLAEEAQKRDEQPQQPGGRRHGPRLSKLSFERQTIHVLTPSGDAPLAPAWCITDKHLIVALYPGSIKAFLARGKDFRPLTEVPQVKAALSEGKPLAIIYSDTRRLFDLVYPILTVMSEAVVNQLRREGIDVPPGLLPSAGSIRRHLRPSVTTFERSRDGLEIVSRQSVPGSLAMNTLPVSLGLLLPAVQKVREAAGRTQSSNNLKQIGLAMHNYHDSYGSFPPAYTASKAGKPLLSWRVHILPFIEQNNLYNQFHLDEPWDSEHNKKLIPLMPKVYRSPASNAAPGMTTYLTIRGENTAFPGAKGVKLTTITDGLSNTVMAVEASDRKAVIWTRPDDLPLDEKNPRDGLGPPWPGGILVLFCDGSVRMVGAGLAPQTWMDLFLGNDGHVIPNDL